MKDTILTARRKKTEIYSWLVCFVIANIIHVYAIVEYKASFTELFTSIFYVLAFSVVLYFVWCILRIGFYLITRPFKRKH